MNVVIENRDGLEIIEINSEGQIIVFPAVDKDGMYEIMIENKKDSLVFIGDLSNAHEIC